FPAQLPIGCGVAILLILLSGLIIKGQASAKDLLSLPGKELENSQCCFYFQFLPLRTTIPEWVSQKKTERLVSTEKNKVPRMIATMPCILSRFVLLALGAELHAGAQTAISGLNAGHLKTVQFVYRTIIHGR